MKALPIVKIGDPILKKDADPVTNFGTRALDELVKYLFYNLKHYSGAGLAAPQIGESKRVIVYGFDKNPRYPNEKPIPLTVLVNPEITYSSEEMIEAYEGCLSIPNMRGLIPRSLSIRYKAYNPAGKLIEGVAHGFEARAIQHEIDHLNGILYPMRMDDLSTLKYTEN